MSQITRLVLADVTAHCAEWRSQGIDVAVSINVQHHLPLMPAQQLAFRAKAGAAG